MNQIELKCRASRLMNRMNAMGFTKDGKPMVIDQAYELVAAEEGYRNQHVLRTKLVSQAKPVRQLPQATTLVKPDGRQLREQAEAAYENYDFGPGFTVCAANGWETIDADTTLTRVVFLSDDANPDADSKRVVFIFDAQGGEVTTTHIE